MVIDSLFVIVVIVAIVAIVVIIVIVVIVVFVVLVVVVVVFVVAVVVVINPTAPLKNTMTLCSCHLVEGKTKTAASSTICFNKQM